MSRIGNSVIVIPADVTLSQLDGMVVVKGKNGELSAPLHTDVELSIVDNIATLKPKRKTKLALSLWGTMRASGITVPQQCSRSSETRRLYPQLFKR